MNGACAAQNRNDGFVQRCRRVDDVRVGVRVAANRGDDDIRVGCRVVDAIGIVAAVRRCWNASVTGVQLAEQPNAVRLVADAAAAGARELVWLCGWLLLLLLRCGVGGGVVNRVRRNAFGRTAAGAAV